MRQPKVGKISTSVALDVSLLERLNQIATRTRVSRSTIVRDAIEHELERYEKSLPPKVVSSPRAEGSTAATAPGLARP